jgi:Protein of unknown function (DUF3035)
MEFRAYPNSAAVLFALGALVLGGCSSTSKTNAGDFQVAAKAPLVIPPDYALKPQPPGTTGEPQNEGDMIREKQTTGEESAYSPGMSTGERALVASAGALRADPQIRQIVDQDSGNLIVRTPDFAERLIFWGNLKNSADDQQRLQQAQAGKGDKVQGQEQPTIRKTSGGGIF